MSTGVKLSQLTKDLKRVITKLRDKEPELTEELLDLQSMIERRKVQRPAGPFSEVASPQEAILAVLKEHRGERPLTKLDVLNLLKEGGFRRSLEDTAVRKLVDTTMGNMKQDKKVIIGPGRKMRDCTIELPSDEKAKL